MYQLAVKPNPSVAPDAQPLEVLHWHSRHVVFDPAIQPMDTSFVFLYFVQGRALCARSKKELSALPVRNPYDYELAIEQYLKWRSTNPRTADQKLRQTTFVAEDPPAARMKCPVCDGFPSWVDAIVKPTYGVMSEGTNIVERCPCGSGWVDNIYRTL